MYPLPMLQELGLAFPHLRQQTSQLRTADPDAVDDVRMAGRTKEVDLGLPVTNEMDVRWRVVLSVDHESDSPRARWTTTMDT